MNKIIDLVKFNNFFVREGLNEKEIIKQKKFCDQKYKILIKIFAKKLNNIHNLNEDFIFWDKVLGQFLYYHIYHCSRFYRSVKNHKLSYATNILPEFKIPENSEDYRNLIQHSRIGQEKMFLEYVTFFKLKKLFKKEEIPNSKKIPKLSNFILVRNSILKKIFYLTKPRIMVSVCDWKKKYKFLIFFKSLFKIQNFSFSINQLKTENNNNFFNRKEIFKLNYNDKFVNFFFHTIKFFFPKSLLENFDCRHKYTISFLRKSNNLKYIINESLDEDNLLLFACSKKFNVKTVYSEHNFLQYFFLCNALERIFKKIDIFLSLGWSKEKIKIKNRISFFKSGSLFSFNLFSYSEKKIDCLYLPDVPELIPPFPTGAAGHAGHKFSEVYVNRVFNFFSKLDKEIVKIISYKPYDKSVRSDTFNYNSRQFKIEEWLLKNSALVLDSKLKGADLIPRSKLLITDYLSTTYLQGISSNIPTIVITGSNYFFEKKYANIFDDFYKVKIFHKDENLAALFVNKTYKNINAWWNSEDVQNVIKKFLKNNLYNEERYIKILLNLLNKKF
jgi:putative transferase (TIGR04331 family)